MREKTHILLTVFLMSVLSLTLASPGLVQLQPLDEQLHALCSDRNSSASDIKSLIDSGADVNAENPRGLSPLMLAARYHRDDRVIIVLLAFGAELEGLSHSGHTAFMFGIKNQNAEVVQALLDAGANYAVRGPRFDETPLMNASRDNQNPEIVEATLKAGASLTAVNKFDMNALDHAAKENPNPEVTRVLIERGADVNRMNKHGTTPLMWAARKNTNPDVIMLLLEQGADPNIRNLHGQSALDLIKSNEHLTGTMAHETLKSIPPATEPRTTPAQPAPKIDPPLPGLTISKPLPSQSSTQPISKKRYRYAVIPLHGGVGKELHADILDESLTYLKQRKCDCVIFDIDSPGGYLPERNKIAAVMQNHSGSFVYVAVIKNALSAAVLPSLNCDYIFLEEGGTIGAAVPFWIPPNSAPEVEKKIISADAALLESTATKNGWNPLIIRPMVVMEESLYCWVDAQGNRVIDKQKPADSSIESDCIDDEHEVLTLSSDDAALLGFPTLIPKREFGGYHQDAIPSRWKAHKKLLVSHIAEHVNKDQTWTPCGGEGYGAMAFLNAAKAWTHAEVNFDRRTGLIQSIKNNVDDAQASDPDRQSYSFDTIANHRYNSNGEYVSTTYSEQPTRSSWDKWYGSTDKSAYLWQLIIQEIDELFAIEELGSKYYVNPISHMDELRNVRSLGEREIQRLLNNRGRGPQG